MLSTYDDASAAKKVFAALRAYLLAPAALIPADIIHIHLAGEISLLRKLPILSLAKALRKHVVIHLHAHSEESLFAKTPRWAWKYTLQAADRVIALSPLWAEIIQRHVPKAVVVVVPNPVKRFPPTERSGGLTSRVLFVGKLEARKGFDTLIAAAAIVLQQFPQTEFWFAGHGELDAARAHAVRLGIGSQVRLLGWIDGAELERVYGEVDVLCLPSHSEGIPMSMLEAMSHALPTVCTAVGGVLDVIKDGENGLIVEPGSPESVAAGILWLLRDPESARAIGSGGYKTVQETCGLEAVAAQLTAIYRDIASPKGESCAGVPLDI